MRHITSSFLLLAILTTTATAQKKAKHPAKSHVHKTQHGEFSVTRINKRTVDKNGVVLATFTRRVKTPKAHTIDFAMSDKTFYFRDFGKFTYLVTQIGIFEYQPDVDAKQNLKQKDYRLIFSQVYTMPKSHKLAYEFTFQKNGMKTTYYVIYKRNIRLGPDVKERHVFRGMLMCASFKGRMVCQCIPYTKLDDTVPGHVIKRKATKDSHGVILYIVPLPGEKQPRQVEFNLRENSFLKPVI